MKYVYIGTAASDRDIETVFSGSARTKIVYVQQKWDYIFYKAMEAWEDGAYCVSYPPVHTFPAGKRIRTKRTPIQGLKQGVYISTLNLPVIKQAGSVLRVLRELKRNWASRRAVIDIRDWQYDSKEGNENPACLQHMQFLVRDGKLHMKVMFRSNDACKATYMNAFALIMVQKRMADDLGFEMGSYTHRANSFHCYAKDFDMLDGYIARLDAAESEEDITYDYEGGWKFLMEACQPEIAAMVEELKKN